MHLTPAELSAVDARLSSLDMVLREISYEEHQLRQRLSTLHSERVGILCHRNQILNHVNDRVGSLPTEIVSHIFALYAYHPSPSVPHRRALQLSRICHRWRSVAVGTPMFWTYLDMREGRPFEKTATYLERSSGSSLMVNIDLTDINQWGDLERRFMAETLVPQLRRCRTFHLSAMIAEPFHIILPRFVTQPAPDLEECEIFYFADEHQQKNGAREGWNWATGVYDGADFGVDAFGGHAPNMRTLTVSGLHVPWLHFNIDGLTSFGFDFHSTDVRRSLRAFMDILAASPNLRRLTVMQGGEGLRISPNWLADEPSFGMSSVLSRPVSSINASFSRITLPALDELVYTFAETGLACDLISLISSPAVRSLTMEYIKDDCAPLLELLTGPPSPFPEVAHLRLVGLSSIAPGRMLHFLRGTGKNVTSLHINAVNCPTLKEIAFLVRWMAMERREYLMPNLKEVSSEGLSPRNLREMIQSRPQDRRPNTITMRRRDWVVPDDECMQWLMEKVDVRFVEGSSDDEDDD
ncbi:hypothetical protein FRB96_006614 [Tulasnella sp. 330]|nr:hypothetical protein FRB96_006614 [Tulasnella sp. 330]KAG8884660.1 hypothetical protein FRB97_003716 [Tulasnella sp. 331]KAG8889747.1 hypothetical protein FRB98_003039 [Tulasnella sp. 332]